MMKRRRGWWLAVLPVFIGLLFLGLGVGSSQPVAEAQAEHPSELLAVTTGGMLQVGEELEYDVSYSFFHIGTIRTCVVDREFRNGKMVYKSVAYIDSNPSLSWLVDLHIRFYSEIDDSVFSYAWISDDSTEKEIYFRRFKFDYSNNRALLEKGKIVPGGARAVEGIDTVSITERCQDGLSLYYYARENVRQKKQVRVATLIERKQEYTFINFTNKKSGVEIDAVNHLVEVVEFDGKAEYVGVFGLTGGFRGWFSNDDARIPVLARMNVILGSIKIELVRWTRTGWQPPLYVEEAER
ncbi:MAG: DUF3108 domain-containing protein [Ignavibacteria bacterium]|nr:DUF3108 domain-containing protein [Ignavibacteria bacterium]